MSKKQWTAQDLNAFLHERHPEPFNPSFRPGFGVAVGKAYDAFCEACPDVTRETRKALYGILSDTLRPFFPSVAEGAKWNGKD